MKVLAPKRLILEWRYSPTLEYFSKYNASGASIENDFPTWKWKAGAVELLDEEHHRKVGITSHRSVYIAEWVHTVGDDLRQIKDVHRKMREHWSPSEYERLGFRFTYAIELKLSFAEMTRRIKKRMFLESDDLRKVWGGGEVEDIAYIVETKDDDTWFRNISAGPMTAQEWCDRTKPDPDLFSTKTQEMSFTAFKKSLPANPLYFDVDMYCKSFDPADFDARVDEAYNRVSESAKALLRVMGD